MTELIQALEFGFGLVLVVVVVVLFIWGLTALDKLTFLSKSRSVKIPKILAISKETKDLIVGVSAIVLGIVGGGGLLGLALSAIFLPGSGTSHVAQPPPPNYGFYKTDEYDAAKHFIQAQYPGAQTFSSCDDSTVQASPQGDCIVKIDVGGVNGFNAPIRDTLTVFMKFQEGNFGLQRIDSQNEAGLVQQQIKDGY
jgi:hypothetical protein